MTYTALASKEQLEGLIDINMLSDSLFVVTITPISDMEADEMEFRSLKGIAGKWLDLDEIRKERLNL